MTSVVLYLYVVPLLLCLLIAVLTIRRNLATSDSWSSNKDFIPLDLLLIVSIIPIGSIVLLTIALLVAIHKFVTSNEKQILVATRKILFIKDPNSTKAVGSGEVSIVDVSGQLSLPETKK